ncbi:barstar family protein [Moellerella wisconsensis]|uniref:barstar family protein n=1 Tax=Moellerella wisconsensis TaxID=158849 RepID=UPI001F4DC9C9|nr:barstar family protein [Moellerella wisconsensis]UNH42821.1 barstar family protein [Moellerella wisconsensis]WJW82272.1 barstar family protein [Moellerella wisconsensis]
MDICRTEVFDFDYIESIADFYQQFQQRFQLPEWFGHNLDALWDMLNGEIELPICIVFRQLDQSQWVLFSDIIELMIDAQEELNGQLIFHCSI